MISIRTLLKATLGLFVALLAYSCSCDDDQPVQPPPRPNTILSEYSIIATHTVGSSACPQFLDLIDVYCSPSAATSCTADSVVISNPHPQLNTKFANGGTTFSKLNKDPMFGTYFTVEFNCTEAKTVNHTYVLILYKDGVEVGRENLLITVTVV